MELPRSYPYNASLKGMALGSLLFGTAAAVMGHQAIHNHQGLILEGIKLGQQGATIFYWIICAAASVFVIVALLALWRRQFHPRTFELGTDSLILPHGFLQRQISRIAYAEIQAVQEHQVSSQRSFHLLTPKGRFVMASALFPDKQSYEEVRDFLIRQLQGNPTHLRRSAKPS